MIVAAFGESSRFRPTGDDMIDSLESGNFAHCVNDSHGVEMIMVVPCAVECPTNVSAVPSPKVTVEFFVGKIVVQLVTGEARIISTDFWCPICWTARQLVSVCRWATEGIDEGVLGSRLVAGA